MDFHVIRTAIAAQFERMHKTSSLFRSGVEKDALWPTYLSSFPDGSNPLFRERTVHDCTCCKQFIRSIGNVVAIIDGKVQTIWDVQAGEYQPVVNAMATVVRTAAISDVFLHDGRTAGTDKSFEDRVDGVVTYEHFFVNVPTQYVAKRADIPSKLADPRTTYEMVLRAVNEITPEAVDTVLELIAQGTLYRGAEHKFAVESFRTLQRKFKGLAAERQSLLAWTLYATVPQSISRIRSTVIGTLLTDLSEGRDLEAAVSSFETKVAPTNYKRPTALVTQGMIDKAKATVEELGLTSALDRRYARLSDITVNNILFADRTTRVAMGGAFDDLTPTKGSVPNLDRIEEVSVDRFFAEILPRADSIEVLVENRHANNLLSLIAPVDPTAGQLFKWDNNFSWSYTGEVTDAIRERVKKAGGNVSGDLCCRLAWSNFDDLDLHMLEPGGSHIYYGNRESHSGGQLDVDMNAGGGRTRDPVENIFYQTRRRMREGVYQLYVNNFSKRETIDVGFEVEIDYLGSIHRFSYPKAVGNGENVQVARFKYSHAGGIEMLESLPASKAQKTIWGLTTETFQKVNVVMLSPNHWDGHGVGNKHVFFMLAGCRNDGTARGFFNELLKEDLNTHRKVFEIVGAKMKVADSPDQLSGIGFSYTQPNTLVCRVKGSFARTIKVVF